MSYALALVMFISSLAFGAEKNGVKFDDQMSVSGQMLKLNGLGTRKAFGVVTVYVAGLYLETPTQSADDILGSSKPRVLLLKFVMDVDRDKITEAWSDGFKKNCQSECGAFQDELSKLNSWMRKMKTGETMMFTFSEDEVKVSLQGEEKGILKKPGFPTRLLAIWLGKNPPNQALKDGLLKL